MSPLVVLDLYKEPGGSSITVLYRKFQRIILLGLTFLLAIITFLFLSTISKSIENFIKKVCIPNRVLKIKASGLSFLNKPIMLPRPFVLENCFAMILFLVAFTITF